LGREAERLLCNLAALRLAAAETLPLAVSVHRNAGTGGSRTRNALLAALRELELLRLVAKGGIRAGAYMASAWLPSPAFYDYLPDGGTLADLSLASRAEYIVIRDEHGQRLPLPAEAATLNAQMSAVNDWLSSLPVTVGGRLAWLTQAAPNFPLRIETSRHVDLYRTFNGSLERGGRLYGGFWIQQPREWRFANLRLAGEPIASCDFREAHLRLAYRHFGMPWPFSDGACAYTAGDGQRAGYKRLTNALLQASTRMRQWPGSSRAEQRELRAMFPRGAKPSAVIAAVTARHPGLTAAGAFERGLGGLLTRAESDITAALLLACRDAELPCLPVHDCLLVPASRADEAAQLMEQWLPVSVTGA
jgi:hypothetical protein